MPSSRRTVSVPQVKRLASGTGVSFRAVHDGVEKGAVPDWRAAVAGRIGTAVLLVMAGALGAVSRSAWPLTVDPPTPSDLPVPPTLVQPAGSSGGLWLSTFDDEFDGSALDGSKWSNGFGWGDSAANFAAWCDPAANVVDQGVLVQWADKVARGDKAYRGACLHTKG